MRRERRLVSFALAIVMFFSVFHGFAPIKVRAATEKVPTEFEIIAPSWNRVAVYWKSANRAGKKSTFAYKILANNRVVESKTGETLTALNYGGIPKYKISYTLCVPATKYSIQVGITKNGLTNWSNPATITTPAYKDTNYITKAAAKSNTSVGLSFLNKMGTKYENPTGYYIYRSTNGGKSYAKIASVKKSGVTTYTDKKCKFAKAYRYKLAAYKVVSGRTYISESPAVTGTIYPIGMPKVKTKAVIVKNRPTNKDYLKVTWGKVSKVDGYQVWLYSGSQATTIRKKTNLKKTFTKKAKRQWKVNVKKLDCYSYIDIYVRAYKKVKGKKVYGPWKAGKHQQFFRG
ncbi:MAG: hypothetical protein PHD70_11535 [Anaerostipes sp.]|nr:hypothetical protein [Anaerostipes sp.]